MRTDTGSMGASEKDEEEAIHKALPAKNSAHFECANRRPCAYRGYMSVVEADILTRVIAPDDASLEKKVAEAVLAMGFKAADRRRMDELADKAREGCLSADERVEADSYERIGHFLSLLKSKARRSLAPASA